MNENYFGASEGHIPAALPSAALVDSFLNNTSDAIVASSFDRTILMWNRGAERLFGYPAREVLGKPFALMAPEGQDEEARTLVEQLREGQDSVRFEAVRFSKTGAKLELEVSLSLISDAGNGSPGILAIARDISAQKNFERALASRLRQQAGLAWLGQQVLAGIDLDTLLDAAASLVKRTLEVDFVEILELKEKGAEFWLRAGGGWSPTAVGSVTVKSVPDSPAGFALTTREPVVVEDLTTEKRFPVPALLLEHRITSGVLTVIEGEQLGQPYGVIGAHSCALRSFSQDDINFLQNVATMLAAAFRQEKAAADRQARLRAESHLLEIQAASRQRMVVLETANRVALDILSSRMGVEALLHIAEAACVLAGARYAALGVAYEDRPGLEQFITSGLTPEDEARIGNLPRGVGVLGLLLEQDRPLRIDNLSQHPASVGFPPNHPPMNSFLGVPIRSGNVTIGSLYLTNKQSGGVFTEADEAAVSALGAYAAVAIHNLRLLSRQRDLTRSLLTAQEEERRAVAHDLHDGLTQYIMAAHAHLEAFKRAHAGGNEEKAALQADKGMEYLHQAVVESRRMINNLRLLVLDDLGLPGALEQLFQEEISRANWEEAHLEENIGNNRFDVAVETAVYRVAQEALTNARKHAQTSRVQLSLLKQNHAHSASLRLEVRDWGLGFHPNTGKGSLGHYGLQGMVERIHLLNGTCEVDTAPGAGTSITAIFPL